MDASGISAENSNGSTKYSKCILNSLPSQTSRGDGGTVFVTCKQSKNRRLLLLALRDIYNSKDGFA
jgi:hypothetical protein